jgi:ATP-dependent RNA helicase DDX3X
MADQSAFSANVPPWAMGGGMPRGAVAGNAFMPWSQAPAWAGGGMGGMGMGGGGYGGYGGGFGLGGMGQFGYNPNASMGNFFSRFGGY